MPVFGSSTWYVATLSPTDVTTRAIATQTNRKIFAASIILHQQITFMEASIKMQQP